MPSNDGSNFLVTVGFANCDFICDGTADDVQIQAAIDAVLSVGSGTVLLQAGAYDISTSLIANVNGKYLAIKGSGWGTVLTNSSNGAANAYNTITITGDTNKGTEWISIQDIALVGSAVCGMGIRLLDVFQGEIANVKVYGHTRGSGWGVGIDLNHSIDIIIKNVVLMGNAYAGLQLANAANQNTIIGGWFFENEVGVRVASRNNVFISAIIEANTSVGVVSTGNKALFNGCWFEAQPIGVSAGGEGDVLNDCWFEPTCTIAMSVLATCDYAIINQCKFNTSAGIINIASGAGKVAITNNMGGLTITDSGAAKLSVRGNLDYITENSGVATVASGQTTVVVAHGLSVTPTADDIMVTPTNSMGNAAKYYIGTLTATEFTITVDADPGATTATFAWKAIVL